MSKLKTRIWRMLKVVLITFGSLFITLCILAFTTLPFWAYYHLGTSNSKITEAPHTIVMLGGSGIPSGDGLIRVFYTARLSQTYPEASVIVAVPGNYADSLGVPRLFEKELELRGVPHRNISFETKGRNTREQALKIASRCTTAELKQPITLVTLPEHMKRAVLTFRKCGFTSVSGMPAFEFSLAADLTFSDSDLKGNQIAPPIGHNLQLRYQFWNHLKYEIVVIREYFGLTYYKMRGWV